MKLQLDQRDPLNGFRFDMLDAGDVKKVVFVIVDEVTFHLGGIHPAVWLCHVDDRNTHVRECVARHALGSDDRCGHNGDDEHKYGNGAPHGPDHKIHGASFNLTWI